jgi:ribosome-binding protein aMBF1 (putative translation factor)
MRLSELPNKNPVCEVCGENIDKRTTVGVESDEDSTWLIRLCHRCGPIDIDLMQLCREITIGCTDN